MLNREIERRDFLKKILSVLLFAFCCFVSTTVVNAQIIEIDTSLDPQTSDLKIDPELVDLDSFRLENDTGTYIIVDNRLVPSLDSTMSIIPYASTSRWSLKLNNGQSHTFTSSNTSGQRITFGSQPPSGTRSRRTRIYSNSKTYYDVTVDSGRSSYSFNATWTERIYYAVTNYSNATTFDFWLTM